MRLLFTPMAESDLESIGDYIASDNPHRAITFVRELRQQCQRIALNPSGYRMLRIPRHPGHHSVLMADSIPP